MKQTLPGIAGRMAIGFCGEIRFEIAAIGVVPAVNGHDFILAMHEERLLPLHAAVRIAEKNRILCRHAKGRQRRQGFLHPHFRRIEPIAIGHKDANHPLPFLPEAVNGGTGHIDFIILMGDHH